MPPTSEQSALLKCLAERSERLARIYDGGLQIFYQDGENPGRFPGTAHFMRELIDKCPILTSREPEPQGDSMKNRIHPLRRTYMGLKGQGLNDTTSLSGFEEGVRGVLRELDRFLEWMEANRPEAAKRTAQLLSDLSGPGQPLPVDVSQKEVARWMEAHEYFKKVAHHGQDNVNGIEFATHMTFIENVILQRLQPRAVAEHDAIDQLVEEGEGGH